MDKGRRVVRVLLVLAAVLVILRLLSAATAGGR